MVKHNNVVPNGHFHKKYCQSSRGPLKVRINFDQATSKKARRVKRAARAAKLAPRPLRKLRPVVRCPSQKYNARTRLGRGFTLTELKGAGFTAKYASTVGIAVDYRRTNRSEEGLKDNVARLLEYKKNLVVFPRRRSKPKFGDSSKDECDAVIAGPVATGDLMPLAKTASEIEMAEVTDEMKNTTSFTIMRLARQETRVEGQYKAAKIRKEKD
mmetsp:Transcript_39629/g.92720  ORF Transcript_39629/g.92720 Transcript_39629/m.92720 type:complete len:213 (-) Transcript_39629:144-782(-)|eukprot:CAMPEP_0113306984 /NCGR_PEP_ID=MMETSP0010_2-20120614/6024_1 /TAXON_ID=216773 ORGANISM="Corethron hystrix, Strain 308" /NCGR_SAMPLE_ID=MMETSP0010_2 /ASSEMBLY_ACC=CAM_ASM_000155 /LENGTH=212 /DNA_ID=CAMNT_0000161775 /DNA_START=154 /DNA_END=792 /DNA_ORIENTATION=+ /assembly_acc=CAM_ASM_000155